MSNRDRAAWIIMGATIGVVLGATAASVAWSVSMDRAHEAEHSGGKMLTPKIGDRVVVATGPHAGRRGTVVILSGDPLMDRYLKLEPGQVRVALDGGRGQTLAEGGAGGEAGIPITEWPTNLRRVGEP